MTPPLFITGCPRSGTSLTTYAFKACGMWAGKTTTQCENHRIREHILKPMLRNGGMDPIALRSWADITEGDPDRLRSAVLQELRKQGYTGGPWLYKDVKLVFCWRVWKEAFPEAVWVTVWRSPEAIVESFGRWGLSANVEFDHERVVKEHHDRAGRIPSLDVFPDDLLKGDDSRYRFVANRLGITWDPDAVAEVVDPERYHVS